MNKILIIIILVSIIAMIFRKKIVKYFNYGKDVKTILVKPVSGKTETKIAGTSMPKLENELGMKQTITFWLWVNDLLYREREFKEILTKSNNNLSIGIGPRNNNNMQQQFNDGFVPSQNKLFVNIKNNSDIQTLELDDFPIQKWLHFAIVVDNRNVDLFMNGELLKSMVLDSPHKLEENVEMIINPNGGFDGNISNINVYNYALNQSEIISSLKDGPITLGIWDRVKSFFDTVGDKIRPNIELNICKTDTKNK